MNRTPLIALLSLVLLSSACHIRPKGQTNGDDGSGLPGNTSSSSGNSPAGADNGTSGGSPGSSSGIIVVHPEGYCETNEECTSKICTGNLCAAATNTDGVQNGLETSTDCGGEGNPACALGLGCKVHKDCESEACDWQGKCIKYKSCTALNGGGSCGEGETPTSKWESCCTTLPLPSGVLADKYLMTAGRARALVDSVGGKIQQWYLANQATLRPETRAQLDPYIANLPSDMRVGDYSVVAQVNGGNIYVKDLPSDEQGCFVGKGAIGTHTYWLTPEDNALYGDSNGYGQEILDQKPLNCAPYFFHAALCAMDNGRLLTFEESQELYGTATYPWGNTPEVGGFSGKGLVGPATIGAWGPDDPVCPNCDTTMMNWLNNYQFPAPLANFPEDYSYFISAPGRFPKDKGPYGHMDAGGDLISWTSSIVEGGYVDSKGRGPYIRLNGSGTFEGHEADYWKWAMIPAVKYGKFSSRCGKY